MTLEKLHEYLKKTLRRIAPVLNRCEARWAAQQEELAQQWPEEGEQDDSEESSDT